MPTVEVTTVYQLPPGATVIRTPPDWESEHAIQIQEPSEKPTVLKGKSEPFQIYGGTKFALKTVLIQDLLDDRLRLRQPLRLTIEKEDECYVATCTEIWQLGFGYGEDPIAAVDDFRMSLAELYWRLHEEQKVSDLSVNLAEEWNTLRKIIHEA